MYLLLGILAVVVLFLGIAVAARRFEAEQRKRGRWDQYGPLEETEPPLAPAGVRASMMERLEVIGLWKGKVLRRRRPNEKP